MKKYLLLIFTLLLSSCFKTYDVKNDSFICGFASEQIEIPANEKVFLAGYHQGLEPTGILDYQEVSAMYINGILLISIDAIAISSKITSKIRDGLKDICDNVNVFATHTHAGIDTLGLWGGIALNGKNQTFMDNLVNSAIRVGKKAYFNQEKGNLYFGFTNTSIQEDSREPIFFDSNIYQFRFVSNSKHEIRLINYAAHAESLRGDNTLISKDYVGKIREYLKEEKNSDSIFIQGAIGGLIMSKELVFPFDSISNMELVARTLVNNIYDINNEIKLNPCIKLIRNFFKTKLDNTLYMYYKFLGILDNNVVNGKSDTGYLIKSEVSILTIDDLLIYFVPGELFPELAYENTYLDKTLDPETLEYLANQYDYKKVLVFGLANDELGYIIPKSDYLLNKKAPYINTIMDEKNENHYEETNSTSIDACIDIYSAFKKIIDKL